MQEFITLSFPCQGGKALLLRCMLLWIPFQSSFPNPVRIAEVPLGCLLTVPDHLLDVLHNALHAFILPEPVFDGLAAV